jgi:hypothetical protein
LGVYAREGFGSAGDTNSVEKAYKLQQGRVAITLASNILLEHMRGRLRRKCTGQI